MVVPGGRLLKETEKMLDGCDTEVRDELDQEHNSLQKRWDPGVNGCYCLMGTEFKFGKMKNFWRKILLWLMSKTLFYALLFRTFFGFRSHI